VGGAGREREPGRRLAVGGQVGEAVEQPGDEPPGSLRVGLEQRDRELVSAHPRRQVRTPQRLAHDARDGP
jgi:hypothetical protein